MTTPNTIEGIEGIEAAGINPEHPLARGLLYAFGVRIPPSEWVPCQDGPALDGHFSGDVTNVEFYPYAMTAEQVREHYQRFRSAQDCGEGGPIP